MISMHSWVFRLMLLLITLLPPVAMVSGLGVVPVFLLMAVPVIPVCLTQKNNSPFANGFIIAFALFFSWALISSFWASDVENALGAWVRLVLLIVLGFALLKGVSRMNEEQKYAIDKRLCFGMLVALLMVVFEVMTQGWVITALKNLIGGKSAAYDPSVMNRGLTFAVLLYWPFAMALHRVLLHRHRMPIRKAVQMNLLLWVGTGSLLVQLESLSATLAFAASTVVFLFNWVFRGRLTLLVGAGIVMCVLATPYLMGQLNSDKFAVKLAQVPPSAEHRLYIWNFALERAQEKPFAGWGFNSSRNIPGGDVLIQFTEAGKTDDRKLLPVHPHNQVLQIWLELGYIGLALFIATLGYGVYAINGSHLKPAEKSSGMAALSCYIIIGYLSYGVWQYWWVASGLLCWILARSTASIDAHAHSRAMSTN